MEEDAVSIALMNYEDVRTCKNSLKSESKRGFDCLGDNTGSGEVLSKKRCKESSNDTLSEVLNTNAENDSSFQATEGNVDEVISSSQAGDSMSSSSGNSSVSDFSEEEGRGDGTSGVISTSHVTLEIPEHVSSSGVRRITLKFSKIEPQPDQLSTHDSQLYEGSIDDDNSVKSVLNNPCSESRILYEAPFWSYPVTVKKLLSSGILEGARVKYTLFSHEKALCGIVSGTGYLCGCSVCNFSEVISAFEFELHAGGKTRHPNHHIYLENGRSIHSIIDELRTAPFSEIDGLLKDILGSAINKQFFEKWRENFHENSTIEATKRCQLEPVNSIHSFPRTSSILHQKKNADGSIARRDNDLHRLLFLPNGLPDGTELAYFFKQKKILCGCKQGNGIFCSHCNCQVSPSQFEVHAGYAARRQPYRHIYTSNGLSLHDIAISLASGNCLGTGDSDDMCTICGDEGHLVACRGCPRAFHAECLGLEFFPEDKWYCQYCRGRLGSGRKSKTKACTRRLIRVVKEPASIHGGCSVCGAHDFTPSVFDARTIIICDQCEREFHVGCLREYGCCDLQELPKDEWFCTDDCSRIREALHNLVSSGAEMIPESASNVIVKQQIARVSIEEGGNDIQWRILNGKSRNHEHLPLLSQAASIFRDCFDPIRTISGRDLIPVMVYGRNICGQEFGGMYCMVLIVNSVVVSACLLRIFGRDAAELPLVATSREYQGNGYFQALFSCVQSLLASLKVDVLVLPASADSESIWMKKFGFRKMSNEQLLKYKSIQFTVFKKTSMLEREVSQIRGF